MAPAQAAFHRPRQPAPCPRLLRRRSRAAARRMAAKRALGCRSRRWPLRRRSRHSPCPLTANRAAQQPDQWAAARRMAAKRALGCRSRRWPLRRRSRHSPCPLTANRYGATFLRLSGATSGNATEDAAVIAIRSPGAVAPLPICCRSTTCCRSPRAAARSRPISSWRALLITACAMATDRLRRRSPRCSVSSVLLPRRSTALADGMQVARRDRSHHHAPWSG